MRLQLNGENYDTRGATTVAALLQELDIVPARVAVEVNMKIVRKADYNDFLLKEGDAVEVVNFVGGG